MKQLKLPKMSEKILVMHLKKQNFGKMNKNKIRKIEKLIGRNEEASEQ